MGIFSRFFKIGEANANRLIDKLEKPEVMLEQAIRDRSKAIAEARQKVQSVIATERQTKALIEREESLAREWEEKAEKALKVGQEDLAAQALKRSEGHAKKAESLKPTWSLQDRSVNNLKIELQKMDEELKELKRDKDIIIAQSKTAEVKRSIYEAKAAIGKDSTSDLIARMKEKANRAGFEAEAAEELSTVGENVTLESKMSAIEGEVVNESVQQKLEAMKARLEKK